MEMDRLGEIHDKMDELIQLISIATLDENTAQALNAKFLSANKSRSSTLQIQNPQIVNRKENNELGQLFLMGNLDRRSQKKHSFYKFTSFLVKGIIAGLLILLGFGMIIMPAPPYFEMFTLFYINPNDGVTIMDVISLIVVFTGIYLLINLVIKSRG